MRPRKTFQVETSSRPQLVPGSATWSPGLPNRLCCRNDAIGLCRAAGYWRVSSAQRATQQARPLAPRTRTALPHLCSASDDGPPASSWTPHPAAVLPRWRGPSAAPCHPPTAGQGPRPEQLFYRPARCSAARLLLLIRLYKAQGTLQYSRFRCWAAANAADCQRGCNIQELSQPLSAEKVPRQPTRCVEPSNATLLAYTAPGAVGCQRQPR